MLPSRTTGRPPKINAVKRRRAEAGSRAPWRHAQRGRSAAETLDAAEHGGMLAFMSEAGHHASDTNLSMLFNDFIW